MTQEQLVTIIDDSVKRAVAAMYIAQADKAKDVYKQTERRLTAYPHILEKLKQDQARLDNMQADGHGQERSKSLVRYSGRGMRMDPDEIFDALKADLIARIACDQQEVEEIQNALHSVERDAYFQTLPAKFFNVDADWEVAEKLHCDESTIRRNRARLVRVVAVRLYGAEAI